MHRLYKNSKEIYMYLKIHEENNLILNLIDFILLFTGMYIQVIQSIFVQFLNFYT